MRGHTFSEAPLVRERQEAHDLLRTHQVHSSDPVDFFSSYGMYAVPSRSLASSDSLQPVLFTPRSFISFCVFRVLSQGTMSLPAFSSEQTCPPTQQLWQALYAKQQILVTAQSCHRSIGSTNSSDSHWSSIQPRWSSCESHCCPTTCRYVWLHMVQTREGNVRKVASIRKAVAGVQCGSVPPLCRMAGRGDRSSPSSDGLGFAWSLADWVLVRFLLLGAR